MDIRLCKRVIRKNFPGIRVDSITQMFGGWSSDVFEVNGKLIFRFPRWPEIERGVQKEISLLPDLAKALSVRVPDFKFIGQYNDKVFVGYNKIPGLPLTSCDCHRGNLAEELARLLTEIHRFPVYRAINLKVPKSNWRKEYEEFYSRVKDEAFPLMTGELKEKAVLVWESFLDNDSNFRFEPAFVHRDLGGEHIIRDPRSSRIMGIIDWEDSCIGDPAIDFTGIYWDCREEFTKRVLAEYGEKVDKTFWDRTIFCYKIGAFHEIAYGKLTNDNTHIQNGLKHLSKVL